MKLEYTVRHEKLRPQVLIYTKDPVRAAVAHIGLRFMIGADPDVNGDRLTYEKPATCEPKIIVGTIGGLNRNDLEDVLVKARGNMDCILVEREAHIGTAARAHAQRFALEHEGLVHQLMKVHDTYMGPIYVAR